jgi:hypothetical protein
VDDGGGDGAAAAGQQHIGRLAGLPQRGIHADVDPEAESATTITMQRLYGLYDSAS